MANHKVRAHIQVTELTKSGSATWFEIFSDGVKIGEIQIGKGSFGWKKADKQIFKTKDWTTFCDWLNDRFYKEGEE